MTVRWRFRLTGKQIYIMILEIIYKRWEWRISLLNKTECKDEIHRLDKAMHGDANVWYTIELENCLSLFLFSIIHSWFHQSVTDDVNTSIINVIMNKLNHLIKYESFMSFYQIHRLKLGRCGVNTLLTTSRLVLVQDIYRKQTCLINVQSKL